MEQLSESVRDSEKPPSPPYSRSADSPAHTSQEEVRGCPSEKSDHLYENKTKTQ